MLDLPPAQLAIVLRILAERIPKARAWAYGSRVVGRAGKFSDLDIAVEGSTTMGDRTLAMLREDLVDSDLPISVDVLDLRRVTPSFRALIESRRVALQ